METNSKDFSLVYKLLSLLFLPPSLYDEQELAILASEIEERIQNNNMLLMCPQIEEPLEKLVNLLKNSEEIKKHRVDLTSTLITSYGKTPCPPYESIYVLPMVKERTIAAPAVTNRLRDLYSKLGVEISETPTLTEDHVSTELEFLSLIHASLHVLEQEEALSLLKDIRKEFLKYMKAWISKFTKCVKENASSELLKTQAELLEKIIQCDYDTAILT